MDDALLVNLEIARDDLFHVDDGLLFGHALLNQFA